MVGAGIPFQYEQAMSTGAHRTRMILRLPPACANGSPVKPLRREAPAPSVMPPLKPNRGRVLPQYRATSPCTVSAASPPLEDQREHPMRRERATQAHATRLCGANTRSRAKENQSTKGGRTPRAPTAQNGPSPAPAPAPAPAALRAKQRPSTQAHRPAHNARNHRNTPCTVGTLPMPPSSGGAAPNPRLRVREPQSTKPGRTTRAPAPPKAPVALPVKQRPSTQAQRQNPARNTPYAVSRPPVPADWPVHDMVTRQHPARRGPVAENLPGQQTKPDAP